MNINIHYDGKGIRHMAIIGELDTREKIQQLLSHMEQNIEETHITFFDSSRLHWSIIEKLYALQKHKRSRVFVLKPYLYAYLSKIGIRSYYVAQEPEGCKKEPEVTTRNSKALYAQQVMDFLRAIYDQYGYDYTQYQIDSIMRRIKLCMLKENIQSFEVFKRVVLENEEVFERLFLDFSINITDFFRDPEVFAAIRDKILPYLDSFHHIKIWCAGCSTGQEAYSLAIMLDELNMLNKTQIYATDINPFVVEEAENGLYPLAGIENNIRNYRNAKGSKSFMKYFKVKETYMEIDVRLKKSILFFQHSLVNSGSINEFQLILCRNVLIYFSPDLQKNILKNFYCSLNQNGFLILGKREGILNNGGHQYFCNYDPENRMFRRRALKEA